MEFRINQLEEWQEIVDKIVPKLSKPILLLKGNLGAGKTTFTQFLIKKLGSQDEASSPTYSIVNEYNSPKGKIFHFDLYRIKDIEELYDIGFEEYLDEGNLCIIEWADIYQPYLEEDEFHEMTITQDNGFRIVNFK
ncbi:MAG: tRNA (adenosine(37)-N6)-threonylcarbamoyltransferase complex ATPase subunit type 1 TsaE [Flavobacteriales bacterium]|nr:MAG: tRNA (adenosine(37)-N6)-threonylcarbamoyltransferase complex ATPase subunit type 1 TsaE [Flavobacteriales bacterium]